MRGRGPSRKLGDKGLLSGTSPITGNTRRTQKCLLTPQPVRLASPLFPENGTFVFTKIQTASFGFQDTRLQAPLTFSDPLVSVGDDTDSPLSMVNPTPDPVTETWGKAHAVLPDPSQSRSVGPDAGAEAGLWAPAPRGPGPDPLTRHCTQLQRTLLFFVFVVL